LKAVARAPGRVNLIGEHTDYNDGFVMPAAIAYATTVEAAARDDRRVVVTSAAAEEPAVLDLDALHGAPSGRWSDYARGVAAELAAAGVALRGADLRVHGTIAFGAGLSSSASFEVAVALALLALAGADIERRELARLCQRAEIEYAGTRCGIMDQFAVLFGRAGRFLLLDTRTMEYTALPVPAGTTVVVANTMVRHELASGEYNRRRAQCEEAGAALRRRLPAITALRDVTMAELEAERDVLSVELYRRARHVVSENARVLQAADALRAGDPVRLGELMNASHESLRTDYEVSCAELEAMVDIARDCRGVYGSRMTGGGFGGCTVTVLDAGAATAFRDDVAHRYLERTGIQPAFYDGTPAGAAEVTCG
jgi:galactokinase